jgi:Na+/melibiose symporter-like transporter
VAVGAVAQFSVWLALRPDRADPGQVSLTWALAEGLLAVIVGAIAPDGTTAVRTVLAGWALQAVHYAVVVPHTDADNLWGVVLFLQFALAGICSGLAWLTRRSTRRIRHRRRG